jgi:hypothetical protein
MFIFIPELNFKVASACARAFEKIPVAGVYDPDDLFGISVLWKRRGHGPPLKTCSKEPAARLLDPAWRS